ncbi:hypothetical protein V8C44DRAFT_98457 [Trichoderma aethiopicum]
MPATTYTNLTQFEAPSSPIRACSSSHSNKASHESLLIPLLLCNGCPHLISSLPVPSLIPICVTRRAFQARPSDDGYHLPSSHPPSILLTAKSQRIVQKRKTTESEMKTPPAMYAGSKCHSCRRLCQENRASCWVVIAER